METRSFLSPSSFRYVNAPQEMRELIDWHELSEEWLEEIGIVWLVQDASKVPLREGQLEFLLAAVDDGLERREMDARDLKEAYLQVHLCLAAFKELESNGDLKAAYEKLLEARLRLEVIAKLAPHWKTEVIAYRKKLVSREIESLEVGGKLRDLGR